MGEFLKAFDWPSWVTSTTSLGFIVVVIGAMVYANVHQDATLIVKLVEMVVPAYLMSKGVTMGKTSVNGGYDAPVVPDVPKSP